MTGEVSARSNRYQSEGRPRKEKKEEVSFVPFAEDLTPIAVKAGNESKVVSVQTVVSKIPYGQKTMVFKGSINKSMNWEGRPGNVSPSAISAVEGVLRKLNYNIAGASDSLFDNDKLSETEFLIGGQIKDMKSEIVTKTSFWTGQTEIKKLSSWVKVEWEIYGAIDRQVVYKVETEGYFIETNKDLNGSPTDFGALAVSQAARNFLADSSVHQILTGKTVSKEEASYESLKLNSSNLASKKSLEEAQNGVVTVFTVTGHGSGFVIDDSGYILTNRHVVQDAKQVVVKLASGEEIKGDVLRRNKKRDVALIKIDLPETAKALSIQTNQAPVGSEVLVVGTPLMEKLSNSVTKGVVSAYREKDGLNWIQSDVTVMPGSSGGPMLDKDHQVIGITVSGIRVNDQSTGINFFIPIQEALEVLALQIS